MKLSLKRFVLIFILSLVGLVAFSGNVAADGEGEFYGFAFITLVLICLVASIIIAVLIGVWIFRDADSRGMNGTLWLVLVIVGAFLGGIIGLVIIIIIYLVVREEQLVLPPGPVPEHETEQPKYKEPSTMTTSGVTSEQKDTEAGESEKIRCPVCKGLSIVRTSKRPIEIKCPHCGTWGELTD